MTGNRLLLTTTFAGAAWVGAVPPSWLVPWKEASQHQTQGNAPPVPPSASRPASRPSSRPASGPASKPALRPVRFTDQEYNYTFQYPSDWKLERTPATDHTKRTRVEVTGPHFAFSVDLTFGVGPISKEQVLQDSNRNETTLGFCRITTNDVYKRRVESVGGQKFKVTDQKAAESDMSLRWYIETFFTSKKGNSMMLCGIHAYPYGKPYIVNLMMVVPVTPFFEDDAHIV